MTEAVVSLCILVIVWIASFNMIVVAKASESRAKHKMEAAYVIQQAIEDMRKQRFALISTKPEVQVTLDTRGTVFTTDDFKGKRTITVTTPNTYYKKVVVKVTWNEPLLGKTKTLTEYGGAYICNDTQAN